MKKRLNLQIYLLVLLSLVVVLVGCEGGKGSKDKGAYNLSAAILDITKRNKEPYTEVFTLKHSFDIVGVPYIVTDDLEEATKHKVIYTGGSLRNTTLSSQEVDLLYSYVETGGRLVSSLVLGNKFFPLFGIGKSVDSRERHWVSFKGSSEDGALKYIDREEERRIPLGSERFYSKVVWSHAFEVQDAYPLGTSEDGLAIFSVNDFGKGRAYAFGLAYTDVILVPHVGKDYEAQRKFVNIFEPGADVYLLILKAIYEDSLDPFVYLSAIPYGHKTAFLLSHDVDAQTSFKNSVDFAELEKKYGVKGTFFITTKYFIDETDISYYNRTNSNYIKQVEEIGGDIGSHTVTHSKVFSKFSTGDEDVSQSNYRPRENPTVFGELKVSKEILDRDIPNQNTISFRAGELEFPDSLIEVMERSGYKYDSTFSANDIMTNFAYRALRRRNVGSEESRIVEIPVTFDDSMGMLRPDNVDEMVQIWLDVIWANADNEAISVLLIHPSETSYKLETEEKLLKELVGKDIWIGDITSYGEFYNDRDRVQYDTFLKDGQFTIKLRSEDIPPWISFVVEDTPKVKDIKVLTKSGKSLEYKKIKRAGKVFLRSSGGEGV